MLVILELAMNVLDVAYDVALPFTLVAANGANVVFGTRTVILTLVVTKSQHVVEHFIAIIAFQRLNAVFVMVIVMREKREFFP